MIREIKLTNFKLFKELSVPIKNLNILSGLNGMGKSSFIQALLLLRQSKSDKNNLNLNGDLLYSGLSSDILCRTAENNKIKFYIKTDNQIYTWEFENNHGKDYLDGIFTGDNHLNLFSDNFHYINAEHIGPRESHERNDIIVEKYKQLSIKKGMAELAIQFLKFFENEPIAIESLKHPYAKDDSLLSQVEAWLQEISPDIRINIEKMDREYLLSFKYESVSNDGTLTYTKDFKPQNVGFALSYSLPYIIAILSAKPGSLLLFENPESHLHPKGQAKIAEMMCLAAQSGVQIFAETHGDHIINESLVQLKEHSKDQNKGIHIDNIQILFFEREQEQHLGKVHNIILEQSGKIRQPPENFFDQFNIHQRKLWR